MPANSCGCQPADATSDPTLSREAAEENVTRVRNYIYRRFAAQGIVCNRSPWADAHGYSLPSHCDSEKRGLPPSSNSPLHDSNFDIGGVRKAFAKAEEVYSLFEPPDAKPPYARLKLATPHDFPEPERQAAYEWLDGLLK